MAAQSGQRRAILAAVLLGVASVVPLAWLQARPRGFAEVAAIFPPWTGREQAFAAVLAAGAVVVREGARDWILVVHGEEPGVIGRLYAAGAWAVVDPVAFGGCLTRPVEAARN
ncbi:MAG TPA: hypothetical protein VMA53_22815 [Stellaceae bacterium]|nr:hypothetical protein [Stellaceae bacterium]